MSVVTAVRERVGRKLSEGVYDNPVVVKELRTRMRGTRAFVVMGAYVLFLTVVLVIGAFSEMGDVLQARDIPMTAASRNIGLRLFEWLTWTQAILLAIVMPSLTCGSISQEAESKTLESLSLTRLSPGRIVFGKQFSSFLYSLMLLVASLPLAGICLMFGGVSPFEIIVVYVLLVGWSFLFTCIGVLCSALASKTSVASVIGFILCAGYCYLTGLWGAEMSVHMRSAGNEQLILNGLNPAWASYSALAYARVCGIAVPLALATMIVHIGMGVLAVLIASTHLRFHRVERALSIRLLLLGLSVLVTWLIVGNIVAVGTRMSGAFGTSMMLNIISTCGFYVLLLVLTGTMALATGELRHAPGESFISYALSLRRAFSSDLRGAMCFVALWTAVLYGAFGLTFLWGSKATGQPVFASFWQAYFKVGISLVAIAAGFTAVGVLVSCVCKSRRNAIALLFLFGVVAFSAYPMVAAYFEPGVSNPDSIRWQIAAFWPMMPIEGTTGSLGADGPQFWWSYSDSWLVTCIAYVFVVMAGLGLASVAARKYGGVKDER